MRFAAGWRFNVARNITAAQCDAFERDAKHDQGEQTQITS
jgi:hypothetical protein